MIYYQYGCAEWGGMRHEQSDKKEIFVIRPSKDLKLKRIEKDIDKLQAMYDLGISDCNKCLQELKEYIG